MDLRRPPERVALPLSPHEKSWLLYAFQHAGQQRAVWLHKIGASGEFIYGSGYVWRCSCGANDAGLARPLTVGFLRSAWSHFDAHLDPAAVSLRMPLARWYRGSSELGLDPLLEIEVARILGLAPDPSAGVGGVLNACGTCGKTFQVSADDPHWSTGRGPICPESARP